MRRVGFRPQRAVHFDVPACDARGGRGAPQGDRNTSRNPTRAPGDKRPSTRRQHLVCCATARDRCRRPRQPHCLRCAAHGKLMLVHHHSQAFPFHGRRHHVRLNTSLIAAFLSARSACIRFKLAFPRSSSFSRFTFVLLRAAPRGALYGRIFDSQRIICGRGNVRSRQRCASGRRPWQFADVECLWGAMNARTKRTGTFRDASFLKRGRLREDLSGAPQPLLFVSPTTALMPVPSNRRPTLGIWHLRAAGTAGLGTAALSYNGTPVLTKAMPEDPDELRARFHSSSISMEG